MKNWFINSFEKKIAKDREKYNKKEFLERYLKRYRSYKPTMNWLLPIVLLVTLLNAILQFSQYLSFDKTTNLVGAIIWTIATNSLGNINHSAFFILRRLYKTKSKRMGWWVRNFKEEYWIKFIYVKAPNEFWVFFFYIFFTIHYIFLIVNQSIII